MQMIEERLRIFEQNARDLREYDAKYPDKLTKVGLLHAPLESHWFLCSAGVTRCTWMLTRGLS